jgi:hypothetical protein
MIADELIAMGYTRLFLAGDQSTAGQVWADGANRDELLEIVRGEEQPDLARVLAAEILHRFEGGFPSELDRDVLARVYAAALELTGVRDGPIVFTGTLWGALWKAPDPAAQGPLGLHLLEAGPDAVPHLVALLGDDAPIFYDGSEDATIGAGLRYRVKDAAAYFIGRLADVDVPFHDDLAARDAEAERLKQTLGG